MARKPLAKHVEEWPWTQTVRGTFVLLTLGTFVGILVGLTERFPDWWPSFVLIGLGLGVAGHLGKRVTHKESLQHGHPNRPARVE
jgi:hypothetical protein